MAQFMTAAEARELNPLDVHIEFINGEIEQAAKAGKSEVIIRQQPYANWSYHSPKIGTVEHKIVHMLLDNGFFVSLHYEEQQFVDIGLKISWSKS